MKGILKNYSAGTLRRQLNATLGDGYVRGVSAGFKGIYQWSINFDVEDPGGASFGEGRLQLKFGPSAWYANEKDPDWKSTVDSAVADYSNVFVTRSGTREIHQTPVTLQEVLDGLAPTDTRLHDAIVHLMTHS